MFQSQDLQLLSVCVVRTKPKLQSATSSRNFPESPLSARRVAFLPPRKLISSLRLIPYLKKAELVTKLEELGETAPSLWTRDQVLLRITEIEEAMSRKTEEAEIHLMELRKEYNKVNRVKSQLQPFFQLRLELAITGNGTMEIFGLM